MLENTFIHIPGVGEKTEMRLWKSGILTWQDFAGAKPDAPEMTPSLHARMKDEIAASQKALEKSDHAYFSACVPTDATWRCLPCFKGRVGYLDIETTGLSHAVSKVTVVGLFDGKKVHSYVLGQNMDEFFSDLKNYSMLVTFNGNMFDIPFLKHYFKTLKIDQVHMDLRPVLRTLGITGGLKKIEQAFNFARPTDLQGMNGWDAVKLWQRWEHRQDSVALDKLVRYNAEDVVHLQALAAWAYEKKRQEAFSRIVLEKDAKQKTIPETEKPAVQGEQSIENKSVAIY